MMEITGRTLSGYVVRWNSPSQELMASDRGVTFTERISPQSFLYSDGVKALYSHNKDAILGTYPKTLSLNQDDHGLAFSLQLPNTSLGNEVRELVNRGDIEGMSFGMHVVDDDWVGNERTIKQAHLREVTITAYPAYPSSSIEVRNYKNYVKIYTKPIRSWRSLI